MASPVSSRQQPGRVTLASVLAVREYRALWAAQLLSIAGDQLARLAVAVLVYDRTRSAVLAAVTFAIGPGAMTIGGLLLSWTADRYPRRAVMLACDLSCLALVLAMAVPGLPLAALAGLLFTVTLAAEPFLAARMAVNRDVLGPDRFETGNGITIATYQAAQLAGFAAAAVTVAAAGPRAALLIDAGTFAASAVLIRAGVLARPAPGGPAGPGRPHILAGVRLVFSVPRARTAMLAMWLAAFFAVPEGVAVPLGRSLGGGPAAAGWLLAAMTAGAAAGPLAWTRLGSPARRDRLVPVMAGGACAVLALFGLRPALAGALVILAASGLLTGYIATAGNVLMAAVPDEHRGQAGGVSGAGMYLGQGLMFIAAGAAARYAGPEAAVAWCGAAGTVLAVLLAGAWRRHCGAVRGRAVS